MFSLRHGLAALLFTTSAALAQTAAPAASSTATLAPATGTPSAAPALTRSGKPRMKVVRAQCRDEVKTERLRGDARKQAMVTCIVKQRPDMEARLKCQMDPTLKGMEKTARHTALQACVAKAKG